MQQKKRKFPVEGVIYSIASKGAGWFHLPFNTGKNKELLDKIKKELGMSEKFNTPKPEIGNMARNRLREAQADLLTKLGQINDQL